MSSTALFHAYILGGDREQAKAYALGLLAPLGASENSITEHVTFSVDDARELRTWQELVTVGPAKARIICTDFITREAQNALLKTLEEPVAGTHIFLCTPNPSMLLDTLRSRAQIIFLEEGDAAVPTLSAAAFLQLSKKERLDVIAKMVAKGDGDDASGEVRMRALSFVDALEAELARDTSANHAVLTKILALKKYLHIPGASVRMLLETIALM
jgi:hypothetical protein